MIQSRGACWTPHHLLTSLRAQEVKMRWGRGITEAQVIEVIPGQAGRGAVPCSPKLLEASWQGWRVLCGVLAFRLLGEALQKDIWILWFLGVGPLRNLGVLPSNSLRRKKGRRERGWGLGIAAPFRASPENRLFLLPPGQPASKREGAVRHHLGEPLSILIVPHPPAP